MIQLRTLMQLCGVFLPLLLALLIERMIGFPLISLTWIDVFRTRLHWPGQLALWLGVGVVLSWIFAWSLTFGLGIMLLHWILMNLANHKPKMMVLAQLIMVIGSFWWLKVPFTFGSVVFILVQLVVCAGIFHYEQNRSIMA